MTSRARPHRDPPAGTLSREEARAYLVGQLGLARFERARGAAGVRAVLARLRCIQLDPLDPLGNNADLVALARVEGIGRGDVVRHLYPGHAFEHFAKERCLLPASAFPHYRDQAAQTPWWRLGERLERLPPTVLEKVLAEVEALGPVTPGDLVDHGRVEPLDWDGWKGTPRATSMALEVLWTRCQVVVTGRGDRPGTKRYDVPRRALPGVADAPATADFARWALLERVEAAGLLCRAGGPLWSMLHAARTTDLPDRLIEEGLLEEVRIEDSPRRYLAPAGFRERRFSKPDDRLRLLGPLDPLLWDRKLVLDVFGFDYVWEVYKPAAQRRWGWYVLPLLHLGRLVGRLEGRIAGETLRIDRLWPEEGVTLDEDALDAALARHARACGARTVTRPRGPGPRAPRPAPPR
jgi:uncharacterized protein YcaQ